MAAKVRRGLSCFLAEHPRVKAFLANVVEYEVAAKYPPRRHRPMRSDMLACSAAGACEWKPLRYRKSVSSFPRTMLANTALAKWRARAGLGEEERQSVERTYLQIQSYLDVRHAADHIHKRGYSLARTVLRRGCKLRPKWRYRAARIGLAVAPVTTRLALRGRS